ncbi:trypsin-like peptidase domain-containing protein [Oceanihabitans sediminis]|uniref:PDZ domain-containing protein n=1 Tax=Oceanihabitans sediminis TaxID=1812012 RepID=A0A368P4H6_9FLAO|nr:trypsin-like peptidase domain-containing protein [Oceanihabitans sediminis]MDX1277772.1 trypsin-like peptidase domain-containing protein [Oceanihabitans sediminis]MDX1774820.1 trypsin-like peptidase domain-containing protein [Oceanihabitans sediminis]RBP32679.1 Do/DeqQ family serine protease [Oceanihabitans sediminis]RCU57777.1 PDZ domain-containing protein [Oceanihabitans sediminis]
MKKILTMLFVSALGGALTLGAYKTFIEKEENNTPLANQEQAFTFPVSNTTNAKFIADTEVSFVSAAEKTVHTVVHVKNVTINSRQMTFEDLFFGRQPQRSQVGSGSGVIISPDGYIITNNHVIAGSRELSVTLNNNKTYDAKIIGADDKTDIALIKIDPEEELPFTTFGDSDQAKIGEWVLAVGNPFNLTSTVTAGIISAKSRDLSGLQNQSFIQTDAAVNPGNSGGALVNTNGDLIGINTAITSQTGSYIGYSFAVPSNIARKVVQDIMEYGNVQHGILGVTGGSVSAGYAEKFGLETTEGFYIEEVEEDSGADMAGLKSGDVIQKIENIKIKKFTDLKGFLNSKSPNDVVNVTVLRDGKQKTFSVTLLKNQTLAVPIIGIIKNAKPEDLRKYKTKNGVKISRLTTNKSYLSYWISNGVKEGDIITSINNSKVNSIEDVQEVLKNRHPNELLRIELINSKGEKERYNFR